MLYVFNVNADDLKVLRKIEFHKKAPKKLISTLLQESNYNDPLPERVYYEKFDLNNDKSKEYFLYLADSAWCGSTGCVIIIASKHGSKLNSLLQIQGGNIFIQNDKTNEYHNLLIEGGKGNYIFNWNGNFYQKLNINSQHKR